MRCGVGSPSRSLFLFRRANCDIGQQDGDGPCPARPGMAGTASIKTPTASAGGMFSPIPDHSSALEDVTEWRDVVKLPDYDALEWQQTAQANRERLRLDSEHYVQDTVKELEDNNFSSEETRSFSKAACLSFVLRYRLYSSG